VEQGAEGFYYRGANHVAAAGNVVVINPGEVHTGQAVTAAGWTYRMLYPEVALVQRAMLEVTGRSTFIPDFPQPVFEDATMTQLIRQLHLTLESPTTSTLERETHFISTLVQLITRHAIPSANLPSARGE